jgi:hypothetical protein
VTAIPKDPRVSELREMFRFLTTFRVLFETTGTEQIVNPQGNEWSLWDLEYLYQATDRLRMAQRQAITLCLVNGMLEKEAAVAMGVSPTNPVGMYATLGLKRLLEMVDRGELERFRERPRNPVAVAEDRESYLDALAAFIRSRVQVTAESCWLFPHLPGAAPRVLVRSVTSCNGFLALHPREVLYDHRHGERPPGTQVVHATPGPTAEDCINPRHGLVALSETEKARLAALGARLRKVAS